VTTDGDVGVAGHHATHDPALVDLALGPEQHVIVRLTMFRELAPNDGGSRGQYPLCRSRDMVDRSAWLDRSVATPPTELCLPTGPCHRVKGNNDMLVLGIDAHKRTHTVVAVDEAGRELGQHTTTSTTTADHLELVRWADQFGRPRRGAVEDCRHLSRRLERDLLTAGEAIVRVPTKMMAHARDAART